MVDVLVVNESEFALVFGVDEATLADDDATFAAVSSRCERPSTGGADHDSLLEHGAADSPTVVVTLGGPGVVVISEGNVRRFEGHRVDAVDTTGAGDCFVATWPPVSARVRRCPMRSCWPMLRLRSR